MRVTLDAESPYAVDKITPGSGTLPDGHAFAGLKDRITEGTAVAGRIIGEPAWACAKTLKRDGVIGGQQQPPKTPHAVPAARSGSSEISPPSELVLAR